MDTANNHKPNEDVEIGQLFKIIGKGFENMFRFIGSVFNKFFIAFVWLVFFIRKRIIILSAAAFLGLITGVIIEITFPPTYKSTLSIKQNYETGENLYESIKYYNGLLKDKDYNVLGATLGLTVSASEEIVGFEIEPLITENEYLVMFDRYIGNLDSLAASKIEYVDYVNNTKDHKHKLQQISIKSKTRADFNSVFTKIVYNIETNPFFVNEQAKDMSELSLSKTALEESLIQSDSLQQTYKRVLEQQLDSNTTSEIGITFEGDNDRDKTREFDLYKSDIELREKIIKIERELKDKENIIDLISSKQDNGFVDNTKSLFGFSIPAKIFYSITALGLAFLPLLGIEFLSYLEKYKPKNL
tara:strand:+ start:496 stop:1569 length:1074 start_codon:yes stop_codon:yes gene_type:complete